MIVSLLVVITMSCMVAELKWEKHQEKQRLNRIWGNIQR